MILLSYMFVCVYGFPLIYEVLAWFSNNKAWFDVSAMVLDEEYNLYMYTYFICFFFFFHSYINLLYFYSV